MIIPQHNPDSYLKSAFGGGAGETGGSAGGLAAALQHFPE